MSAQRKPALLTVDDDEAVAAAVRRDLRRKYGDRYQVLSANSGAEALELLGQVILRDQEVALLLADQRMPQMSGVEFLEQAMTQAPDAKRVLLTAYADTTAAIKAINDVSLDHYLMKPWDPPEEHLYPVLDDLLDQWLAERIARDVEHAALRVVGHRFAAESHQLKDFLARNQVPFRWLELERDPEAERVLAAANVDARRLPVVILENGDVLAQPATADVAARIGMTTTAELDFYDLIIVGSGPAGLGGAVYGASEGLKTLVVEREAPGGQAGQSSRIENYLGFPTGLSGAELTRRAESQAKRFGAEFLSVTEVAELETRGPQRVVKLGNGNELAASAVIIATGVAYRKLDKPGLEELTGRGVYYGAARTEAIECASEEVFVVGGANSAGQAAMYLSKFAERVTILYRGESLSNSMSSYLIDQIDGTPNIRVLTNAEVEQAHGTDRLEAIDVVIDGADPERMDAASMFIFIGAAPRTDWVSGTLGRDPRGFLYSGVDAKLFDGGGLPWSLKRDPYMLETNVAGVFVAGDVRHQSIKRVASAVGEGAMAVSMVHQYIGALP